MKIDTKNTSAYVRHTQVLHELSGNNGLSGATLYSSLRRLENRMHRAAVRYCNGDASESEYDDVCEVVTRKVFTLLPNISHGHFFVNSDPRGYSLKLREDYAKELGIHTDWGRYGILAPEF